MPFKYTLLGLLVEAIKFGRASALPLLVSTTTIVAVYSFSYLVFGKIIEGSVATTAFSALLFFYIHSSLFNNIRGKHIKYGLNRITLLFVLWFLIFALCSLISFRFSNFVFNLVFMNAGFPAIFMRVIYAAVIALITAPLAFYPLSLLQNNRRELSFSNIRKDISQLWFSLFACWTINAVASKAIILLAMFISKQNSPVESSSSELIMHMTSALLILVNAAFYHLHASIILKARLCT